jgi:hypothetical protein
MSALLALLLAGLPLQGGGPTVARGAELQPTTYPSPSGEWEVRVDPDSPEGAGEATYEILQGGKSRWSGTHGATLWDAVVTEDGRTLGFGYSEGIHTWSGRLFVALLGPDGSFQILESRQRGPSRFPDYQPVPSGIDLFQHPDLGTVVVVVGDSETVERGQQWRFFDVEKGSLSRGVRPKEYQRRADELGDYLGAEPVPGTSLFLVHWAGAFADDPVRFSLIGANGRPVWFVDRDDDLRGLARRARRLGSNGLILESDDPATFALWFRREGLRVRYGVEKTGGVWTVHELGREALVAPEPERTEPEPEFAELSPVHLGSIDVSVPDTSLPAVHNVGAFTILDDPERLAFLPADQRERPVNITLVDAEGELITRHDLDELVAGGGTWIDLDWDEAGERFLLIRRLDDESELWAFDPRASTAEEIQVGDLLGLSHVQAFDQGFLVRHRDAVSAFDRKGRRRWGTFGRGMARMGPERIAVIDPEGSSISLLSHAGDHVGSIDLRNVRRGRIGEGTRLEPDVDDGLIFVDSGRSVARFRSDGSILSVFQPTYENGQRFRLSQSVQVGPQARLWTSDRNTLLRLDAAGVVDRRLGGGRGGRTGDSATVAVGPGGQIYAVEKDRGVVRVLDQRGRHLFNCDPSAIATSRDPSLQDVHVSVEEGGATLLSGRTGVFLFSPEGRLARIEERGFDPIRETWYTVPQPDERLVVGQRRAFLIDSSGEVRRTIERRPDRNWLKNLYQASVAHDGSFALLTGAQGAGAVRPGIHLYSAAGDPLRSIWVPVDSETFPALVYDDQRVIYVDECVVHLFDKEGNPVGRFTLPGEPGIDHWQPLLPRHVNELWAFDRAHTIERYELP